MQAQRLVTQPVKRSSHCNLRVPEAQTPHTAWLLRRSEARDLRGRLAAAADAARRLGLGGPRAACWLRRRPVLDLGPGAMRVSGCGGRPCGEAGGLAAPTGEAGAARWSCAQAEGHEGLQTVTLRPT